MMRFVNTNTAGFDRNVVYLVNDGWDDWFKYETCYRLEYRNILIGTVKIAKKNQVDRRVSLESSFEKLPDDYFSLGVGVAYYTELKKHDDIRAEILEGLNDMAFNLDIFEAVKNEDVTQWSLLRECTPATVRGQYHRLAHGKAELTDYYFKYAISNNDNAIPTKHLEFEVNAGSKPGSNVHVLVGNNGIGKTTILRGIINAVVNEGDNNSKGKIISDEVFPFANVVNVSFSIFDDPLLEEDVEEVFIPYSYVGVFRYENGLKVINPNTYEIFLEHYTSIMISGTKKDLWKNAIKELETDVTFRSLNILSWTNIDDPEDVSRVRVDRNSELEEILLAVKQKYRELTEDKFKLLSSGHTNILLTLASLIDKVEERTLVVIDEPEGHLHPTLISAFIRALSDLLTYRNGVAIIATHSSVIVQAVPSNCVWIIERLENNLYFHRPKHETFGDNLGEIATDIFKYNILETYYHKEINDVIEKANSYEEALEMFGGQLGDEARALLRAYMLTKEKHD